VHANGLGTCPGPLLRGGAVPAPLTRACVRACVCCVEMEKETLREAERERVAEILVSQVSQVAAA
jgi:hypothetical protein